MVAALKRGECLGILPAARGFFDGFAGFLLEMGMEGQCPFTAEAILECFAKSTAEDFLQHQKQVLKRLVGYCPAQFRADLWVMDSVHFQIPNGAHNDPSSFKAYVLGVWQGSVVWPMLWAFVPESRNETVVGKEVMAAAEEVLGDEVVHQGLVTTSPAATAEDILHHNGLRWTLAEVFMTLTRYWQFDKLPPCRPGVAYALVHFALNALTLLGFYLQESDMADDVATWNMAPPPFPMPERELAVYAGGYFAVLRPSELVSIILNHVDAWQANRDKLLLALTICEGGS